MVLTREEKLKREKYCRGEKIRKIIDWTLIIILIITIIYAKFVGVYDKVEINCEENTFIGENNLTGFFEELKEKGDGEINISELTREKDGR